MQNEKFALGWLRDMPDIRDWDVMLGHTGELAPQLVTTDALPASYDGREYCSPIENQRALGSCTAQSVAGMVEYLERKHFNKHVNASRLFLYKMARQLDGLVGDTGAQLRTAMKALRLFGMPPEKYWPYQIEKFEDDPTAFVFALAQNWQARNYYRIDIEGRSRPDCLTVIKRLLTKDYPVVFGFLVFSYGTRAGDFPMPTSGEKPSGGHAVMACGYDDDRVIGRTKGAILLRNSWGKRWGDEGYGWLPYEYVTQYLTADFWTLINKEFFMR